MTDLRPGGKGRASCKSLNGQPEACDAAFFTTKNGLLVFCEDAAGTCTNLDPVECAPAASPPPSPLLISPAMTPLQSPPPSAVEPPTNCDISGMTDLRPGGKGRASCKSLNGQPEACDAAFFTTKNGLLVFCEDAAGTCTNLDPVDCPSA